MTTSFPPVHPHDGIVAVFDNIFMVTGSVTMMQGTLQISRNMIIVRDGNELTLISAVRLDEAALEALEALGEVKHVVKLGAYHGMDDPFYVDRYQANLWALPGMEHTDGLETTHELRPGGELPFTNASLFDFETSKMPEGLFLVHTDGGCLLACDSLQNWTEPDHLFNAEAAEKMQEWGFIGPANIGPGWLRGSEPQGSDFERLLALEFRHMIPSHGTPLKDDAKEALTRTCKRLGLIG